MSRVARYLSLVVLGLLLPVPTPLCAQQPGTLPNQSLDEMVSKAERIVQGQVVSARVEPHPQFSHLKTVLVTLRVEDTLKGTPAKTLEFRQYLWGLDAVSGAAGYAKGEDLLLFLNPVSRYGLTSPVGLDAGRFRIERQNDQTVAVNGKGNAGLFHSTQQRAQKSGVALSQRAVTMIRTTTGGPVPLQELKETIRAFVGAK
jgi:hypothetical protein